MILLLKQPWVSTGMLATIFSYGGYHIFFTYLRPFLQHTLSLPANTLSMLLLLFAIGNFIGTMIAGWIMHYYFKSAMIISHIIFFILSISLFSSSNNSATDSALVVAWGFMFGFLPVGWSTWIAITLANKSEMMGGLSVAAIQFAIGLAAAIGGSIYDHHGINGIFMISALIFIVALFLIQTSLTLLTHTTTKQLP